MKRLIYIYLLGILLLFLTSCRINNKEEQVVCSIYPISYLCQNMLPSNINIYTIAKENQDAHDITLSVNDMQAIEDASLIVLLGLGLEEWSDSLDNHNYPIVECSEGITLINNNVHIWLDVSRYMQMANNIYQYLIHYFSAYEHTITEKYQSLIDKLVSLDEECETMSQNIKKTVVTVHNGYVYLADHYHFKTLALSSSEELTVSSLKTALEYLKTNHITTVYYSSLDSEVLLSNLKNNYSLNYVLCDTYEANFDDYIKVMKQNMNNLVGLYE